MKIKLLSNFITTAISVLLMSLNSFSYGQSKTVLYKNTNALDVELAKKFKQLSPEDSIAKIELPVGYSLELVLSEPNIMEPVSCVFDGNGRMYVVEMNTYMQDADGTGEFDHSSRISLHEDTNGDGRYDKSSIFVDKLLLPRMVLPLEDSIVVGTTNTLDLHRYKDTNGDGVADQKSLYYKGGKRGGNMEHQPSGLIWSMDNWAYTTYTPKRYKMGVDKMIRTENTASNGGQWGLTQDNYGKPWFVNAGGERGPVNYQHPILYGKSGHFKDQAEKSFKEVFPICPIPDVQGGAKRLKPFKGGGEVLNHFTATCGQDIYRGDRLPKDLQGDLLFAEPVGRLIRRAKVEVRDGVTFLSNASKEGEFIRSSDPNFRPVNMVTAPDGTLYIVDMYRGIIQEGNWTKKGSYLRGIIDKYGIAKSIQHGRIYRLVHKDFKRGPKPKMIGASSVELVNHLSHPNGWWRDTAQKILVLRGDKSVKSKLESMYRGSDHLTRMHILWTLEGIGSLDVNHVESALKDEHPQVRRAAIRIAETLIKVKDASSETLMSSISKCITDEDPEVVMQVILTAELLKFKNRDQLKLTAMDKNKSKGVGQTISGLPKVNGSIAKLPKNLRTQHKRGKVIYEQLCGSCHGDDGKGSLAGKVLMAPPLAGSESVTGHYDQFINIVLHGLEGPVNGKEYSAPMVSMKSQDDQWIADVTSYIRNDFGNSGGFVSKDEVARVRKETKERSKPWTIAELQKAVPQKLDSKNWTVTASHNSKGCQEAIDGDLKSRYTTKARQEPGMWFQIELAEAKELSVVKINTVGSPKDYPERYLAEISKDGKSWATVKGLTKGDDPLIYLSFPARKAKFFRITNKGKKNLYWSIHEISVYGK